MRMFRALLVGSSLLLATACSGIIDNTAQPDGGAVGNPDGAVFVDETGDSGVVDPGDPDASVVDPNDVAMVCARWNSDRENLSEGTWTGDVATCNAGEIQTPGRENALRLINLYRWLADLPAVSEDTGLSAAAQECALMQKAHGSLSHSPTPDWECYTTEGANAAGRSNISSGPGVRSIDAYMADIHSINSLGHRRWILSNSLGRVGMGSTNQHSCLYVISGGGTAQKQWTAFPPPGVFPLQAIAPGFGSTDAGGWSIQSDYIRLNDGVVTVTANGQPVAVDVSVLPANYGSSYALRIAPNGWTTQADTTYHVSVTNIDTPIEYDIDVVDCQ